jgi:hypothetical protein
MTGSEPLYQDLSTYPAFVKKQARSWHQLSVLSFEELLCNGFHTCAEVVVNKRNHGGLKPMRAQRRRANVG